MIRKEIQVVNQGEGDVSQQNTVEISSESTTQNKDQKDSSSVDLTGEYSSTQAPAKDAGTEEIERWEDFSIPPALVKGIYSHGFDKPSKIQSRGIKPILSGHDVIAQAQSGTGKTGTFSIATLGKLDLKLQNIQTLILAPTRELASQIYDVITGLGLHMEGLRVVLIIGGVSRQQDYQSLETNPHVVIGTPGRVSDLIVNNRLIVSDIRLFILDEADEMLSRGFSEQVHKVFMYLHPEIQVVLISATMPHDVLAVTKKFMRNPVTILVKNEELTLEGIRQFYIDVQEDVNKIPTLIDLFKHLKISQAVVFCNTKRRVENLCAELQNGEISVSLMHGGMEQPQRESIMENFRKLKTRVLVSTDLLSRGIDVQQVSIVINYDLPKKEQTYIHRIGRGGRFGRKGIAINFVCHDDSEMMRTLEDRYNCVIEEMPTDVARFL